MELPPLTCEQVRRIDRVAVERYRMCGLVLMENAGRGAAEIIHRNAPPGEVAVLCGRGNNGGDGLVVARHLEIFDRPVRVIVMGDPGRMRDDAAANYRVAEAAGIPIEVATEPSFEWMIERLDHCATVVDAMLGTGASGNPKPPMDVAIRAANELTVARFALDVPSGLDADSGEPADVCFHAADTCTFVAPKSGFAVPQAQPYLGRVHVVGIGVPNQLLKEVIGEASS